jgi:hypothetical protein
MATKTFRSLTWSAYLLPVAVVGFTLAGLTLCGAESNSAAKKSNSKPAVSVARGNAAPTTGNKSPQAAAGKKPKLSLEQLRALVQEKLSRNPNYSPGFLISHRDVEPIFNTLLEMGITISADQEGLYDSILPDNAPLVKLLKTPNGRAFMKKIGTDATAYDRLERLSWTYDGRALIERFMSSKDGLARFQKLQTAEQVAKLSKELADDPRTEGFRLPTGRVHTAQDLVQRLEGALAKQAR